MEHKKSTKDYQEKATIKVAFIGQHFVGKTAIITRIATDSFVEGGAGATVGAMVTKKVHQEEGSPAIKMMIWDTAGQERFRSLIQSYYRDAHAVVIVYDITKEESFEYAKVLYEEITSSRQPGSLVIVLVGNKTDQENQRVISKDIVMDFATSKGMRYVETSALSGGGVLKIVPTIYEEVLKSHVELGVDLYKKRTHGSGEEGSDGFEYEGVKKKKCC